MRKEYFKRLTKLLKSGLNSGNLFSAINTWPLSLFRYGAGILEWTKAELQEVNRCTRKRITIYKGMHPRSDVDRLYVERSKGGRGLMSVEDVVQYESHSLKQYTRGSETEIIRKSGVVIKVDSVQCSQEYRNGQKETRLKNWKSKAMNGQHLRQTEENAAKETWQWMKRGSLKRETESLKIAAQDQALRTNYRKAKIEKSTTISKCRLCKEKEETVSHIVSECSKIAQTEYKKRHDRVAATIHWALCKKYGLPHMENWYDHRVEPVMENEHVKLLWDFNVQTDRTIEARRPDLILIDKIIEEYKIIDVAVPGDTRVVKTEEEKIEKYRDLAIEIGKIWEKSANTVPIVIGALGTISKNHLMYLGELECNISFETIQKTALLGTACILRRNLY